MLSEALGVQVAGRYLLLREMESLALDKAGMIDARHYDVETLETFVSHVTVLEQLATTAMGSVTGYDDTGTPVRRPTLIEPAQAAIRDRVQASVLGFVAAEGQTSIRGNAEQATGPGGETAAQRRWREGAAAALARLMYLPCPDELAVLDGFQHDVNLSSSRSVALFDTDAARCGLRKRGLFHVHGVKRMYLAAELAEARLPTRLSHFAIKRFGMPLAFADFTDGGIEVPVIFVDAQTGEICRDTLVATPTHDGFYLAAIPVGDGRFGVALVLGAIAEWVEIERITLVPADDFLSEQPASVDPGQALAGAGDGMTEVAPHLWQSEHPGGFVFVEPPAREEGATLMLAIVFRPVVRRH